VLVIGARLGEMTTGAYSLLEAPVPNQTLIHVHAGAEELGRVYRPALAINSGYPQFVEALEKNPVEEKNHPPLTTSISRGASRSPCRASCSTAR